MMKMPFSNQNLHTKVRPAPFFHSVKFTETLTGMPRFSTDQFDKRRKAIRIDDFIVSFFLVTKNLYAAS